MCKSWAHTLTWSTLRETLSCEHILTTDPPSLKACGLLSRFWSSMIFMSSSHFWPASTDTQQWRLMWCWLSLQQKHSTFLNVWLQSLPLRENSPLEKCTMTAENSRIGLCKSSLASVKKRSIRHGWSGNHHVHIHAPAVLNHKEKANAWQSGQIEQNIDAIESENQESWTQQRWCSQACFFNRHQPTDGKMLSWVNCPSESFCCLSKSVLMHILNWFSLGGCCSTSRLLTTNEKGKMHENSKFCWNAARTDVLGCFGTFCWEWKRVQAGGLETKTNQHVQNVFVKWLRMKTQSAKPPLLHFLCWKSCSLHTGFTKHVCPSNSLCLSSLLWDRTFWNIPSRALMVRQPLKSCEKNMTLIFVTWLCHMVFENRVTNLSHDFITQFWLVHLILRFGFNQCCFEPSCVLLPTVKCFHSNHVMKSVESCDSNGQMLPCKSCDKSVESCDKNITLFFITWFYHMVFENRVINLSHDFVTWQCTTGNVPGEWFLRMRLKIRPTSCTKTHDQHKDSFHNQR